MSPHDIAEWMELFTDHFWIAIAAVAGAIGGGIRYLQKRMDTKAVEYEDADGKKYAARFQTQQGDMIDSLIKALQDCTKRHQDCEENYKHLEARVTKGQQQAVLSE